MNVFKETPGPAGVSAGAAPPSSPLPTPATAPHQHEGRFAASRGREGEVVITLSSGTTSSVKFYFFIAKRLRR
jgi:hypothetical protein